MENRPPRSRPTSPQPSPQAHDGEEADEGQDRESSEADYHSMGSTRVVGREAHPGSEKTHLPEDTAIQYKGEATDDEVTVLGDFELLKKLGEGAMGEVFKARRISFEGSPIENGENVALKILFPHVASNKKLVERLNREAHAMSALEHPNIIEAYAVGEAEGYHFVAMEFVDGDTLQKWLGRLDHRFNIPDALAITLSCARALEYAHLQGMVHRDIKPDNVLIDRRGNVKVADLGMVKTLDEDMALTQTGHAVGTPWYMPMEQAKNAKDVDGRCDIYALGCVLYCLLTGNPPFTGRTLVEVIQKKEVGTFPPARSINPDVPERLDLILVKMTAKLPRYRYQNCTEVIKDLESLGLAADELSFLQAKGAKPTITLETAKPDSSPAVLTNEWFDRFKREGEVSVRMLTTSQVKKMLEEGTLDPTAKASHQPKEGFRSLATFKEFEGTALVKQTKKGADKESAKYRTLYKKIEENERKRDQEEKKSGAPSYYSSLWAPGIMIAGGIGGAIALVYLLIWLFS